MNKKKRVKFADITNSFNLDDSPIHRERQKGPKSDHSPKTSEYAFFKKLKTSSSHKEQNPLKKTESTGRLGEKIDRVRKISKCAEGMDTVTNSCKLPGRNVAHNDYDSFLSPAEGASKQLALGERRKQDGTNARPKGSEAKEANIFSRKRQKLRQWVAENSLPEVDDLSSKGSDLISVLLKRLFPESNWKSSSELPEAMQVGHNTKPECLSSSLSDAFFRKLHEVPARNFMEVEFMPCLEGFPTSAWSGGSGANAHFNFRSPISSARKSHLQMKSRHQNNDFSFSVPLVKYGCLPPSTPLRQLGDPYDPTGSRIQTDFSFDFPPLAYGCLPPSSSPQAQELGDCHEPTGSQDGKETLPRMLGWNFEVMPNDRRLTVTHTNSDFIENPRIISTWENDRILDNEIESFYKSEFYAPSALLDWSRNLYTSLTSNCTFYDNFEHGRYLLAEKKVKDAEEHLPLASLHQLSIPDRPEEHKFEESCEGNDIFLSPASHYPIMHKILGQKQQSLGTETHIPYGLDEECKHLSLSNPVRNFLSPSYHALPYPDKEIMSPAHFCKDQNESSLNVSSYRRSLDHFREDMIDILDRPSFYLTIALDEEKACPLRLDKSSW